MQATSLSKCAVIGDASDPLAVREHVENPHAYRSAFQRDRDRVIHARAFRRLAGKTQVFTHRDSDHFRSRLTHTIEVTQIARTAAAALELNEELVETLALVHDIGHPPFGHAGEQALDRQLQSYGLHFDHNLHALRIVEYFEQRYAGFRGLNLTLAVREGIIKHSRDYSLAQHPELQPYLLDQLPPLEAQLIDLADEIAYLTADMDDGVEAEILSVEDLRANVSLFEEFYRKMELRYPTAAPKLLFHESLKRMLNALVNDLVVNTHHRVTAGGIQSLTAVRHVGHRLVTFSDEMEQRRHQAKQYLLQELYHATYLERDHALAEEIIAGLFQYWMQNPFELPASHETQIASEGAPRVVADYIAGMTDQFIEDQWRQVQGSAKK
ncbi:MAG TPA: dNTP triphosphohydrolase [Acidobacteriaceae bacterium]|nr:dNTP triphosphohydrolase [Acidobacteriaceae bacterium]